MRSYRKPGGDKQQRKISAGHGSGSGENYRPFKKVHELPSHGLSNRVHGWTTNRVHELLSRLELYFFYQLEWSTIVTDIQERFPLLPLAETLAIAATCEIKHPYYKKSKEPVVLATDFLITVLKNNRVIHHAVTVIPQVQLKKWRTIERFELERRYFAARNIDYGIVTEAEIDLVMARNIEWVHHYRNITSLEPLSAQTIKEAAFALTKEAANSNISLKEITQKIDKDFSLEIGSALAIVKYLIASRQWKVKMCEQIQPAKPLQLLAAELD